MATKVLTHAGVVAGGASFEGWLVSTLSNTAPLRRPSKGDTECVASKEDARRRRSVREQLIGAAATPFCVV